MVILGIAGLVQQDLQQQLGKGFARPVRQIITALSTGIRARNVGMGRTVWLDRCHVQSVLSDRHCYMAYAHYVRQVLTPRIPQ